MALGLVIVYGILRLVNFAYGELIMVAGYTMFLVSGSGLPWLVMAACAVVMAVVAGIATDYVAFRPVRAKIDHRGADHLLRLLDAAAERRAALHLAAPAHRAAAGALLAAPSRSAAW